MAGERDPIPQPIRRLLRQEAGFGCCLCGNPIFQYHHIVPYSVVPAHQAKNMMVVCPNHHHEITVGGITDDVQRRAKISPWNVKRGYVNGLLRINTPHPVVEVGTVFFAGAGFKILVDHKPLFAMKRGASGQLELSLDLYDQSDQLLLAIVDNEWISGDPLPWDIEFGVRKLKLRRQHGEVVLKIDARDNPVSIYGDLRYSGQHFSLGKDGLMFNGVIRDTGIIGMGLVGGRLHADTKAGTFKIEVDPRFKSASLVSQPNRKNRVKQCLKALAKMEAEAGEGGAVDG